tara:strand:- start:14 stop:868 length:855 start_codon:yes stop_codon:yes gene_type:complete
MKNLLIIGYGKWGAKVLKVLTRSNYFNQIYIKTRKDIFKYCNLKKILFKIKLKELPKKFDNIHICVPTIYHYKVYKNFSKNRNISIEKPLFNYLYEYNKFEKKNIKVKVNYIDLYNPILKKFFNILDLKKTKKIKFVYSSRDNFYSNQIFFLNEWLDHPLSIILQISDSLQNIKVESNKIERKNKKFNFFKLSMNLNKIEIEVKINTKNKKTREILLYDYKKNKVIFDLIKNKISKNNKTIFSSKINSLENFFIYGKNIKNKNKIQSVSFHKKIFLIKNLILKT